MTILLTLFFTSLIAMSFMVERKVILVQRGKIVPKDELTPIIPDLPVIKSVAIKGVKTAEYIGIVLILRMYVQSGNFIKKWYGIVKTEVKSRMRRQTKEEIMEEDAKKESKFLKTVADYKRKIKKIKYQIVKEEKNK